MGYLFLNQLTNKKLSYYVLIICIKLFFVHFVAKEDVWNYDLTELNFFRMVLWSKYELKQKN